MPERHNFRRLIPWRGAMAAAVVVLVTCLGYAHWHPGLEVVDGRHDRGRNAIWLSHGWLGADEWFVRYGKRNDIEKYRDPARVLLFATLLRERGISDVFPHVAPANQAGELPAVDRIQVERFLNAFTDFRVLPWVGGVLGKQIQLGDGRWRQTFVRSTVRLLRRFPELAGVHLNIEPCPSGNEDFLILLNELRQGLPEGKILSVAAFPPPTPLHPFSDVHWDKEYFRAVSRRADQMAVMMYDTALPVAKLYRALMAVWTRQVLSWSDGSDVLIGVPTYEDAGVGYHHPRVENLRQALPGIHAGLAGYPVLPERYQGLAIYSGWETDEDEWVYWRYAFQAASKSQSDDRPP